MSDDKVVVIEKFEIWEYFGATVNLNWFNILLWLKCSSSIYANTHTHTSLSLQNTHTHSHTQAQLERGGGWHSDERGLSTKSKQPQQTKSLEQPLENQKVMNGFN